MGSNPWGILVDLEGKIIELEIGRPDGQVDVHTWYTQRPALYWSPKKNAIVWVHNGAKPKQLGAQAPPGLAASIYKRWNSKRAMNAAEISIPSQPLKSAGPAVRIVYSSKRYRDGKPRHHDFETAVRVRKASAGSTCVWQLSGGKLNVTSRGLVG